MHRLLFCGLVFFAALCSAQTPSNIASEPHHHLLLQNDHVRVFSMTLGPREQIFVQHEHNFLFVPLQDGELVMWSNGASALPSFHFARGIFHFWLASQASGMRNDQATDFRAVIVEFLEPKVSGYQYDYQGGGWDYASGAINPPVIPDVKFVDTMTLGPATISDVQLLAGDAFPPPAKPAAELLIADGDIDLNAQADTRIRKSSGDVLWIPAGRTWPLTNATHAPARFAVIQLWKDAQ